MRDAVRAVHGILTEVEEGHLEDFFAELAAFQVEGHTIWVPQCDGLQHQALWVRIFEVFFLKDVTSSLHDWHTF